MEYGQVNTYSHRCSTNRKDDVVTDVRGSAMPPAQRRKRLLPSLLTSQHTEEAVRSLTRALAVELGRTPEHDEVLAASVAVAGMHIPLVVEYVKERAK